MDYYQGIVIDYLRADRAVFVNAEFCLQKNEGDNPDGTGPHWYVDALTVDFRSKVIFLCEISFARGLGALLKRLEGWREHWPSIPTALIRDACLPVGWPVRPWLFVPQEFIPVLTKKLEPLVSDNGRPLPTPRITTLEMTQPWLYRSWNRSGEAAKPDSIPIEMRN
jgi:hypothetical protein